MNRGEPYGLATLTAFTVLMVILLVAGCGAIGSSSASVLDGGRSSDTASTMQRVQAADDGIAGCTALLGAHQPPASDYPRIRAQFARSRWPGLRIAGTSYVDLVVKLRTARSDGYETVWFYQRLSAACTRHGWKKPPASGK